MVVIITMDICDSVYLHHFSIDIGTMVAGKVTFQVFHTILKHFGSKTLASWYLSRFCEHVGAKPCQKYGGSKNESCGAKTLEGPNNNQDKTHVQGIGELASSRRQSVCRIRLGFVSKTLLFVRPCMVLARLSIMM